jgi:hypothetical protein
VCEPLEVKEDVFCRWGLLRWFGPVEPSLEPLMALVVLGIIEGRDNLENLKNESPNGDQEGGTLRRRRRKQVFRNLRKGRGEKKVTASPKD